MTLQKLMRVSLHGNILVLLSLLLLTPVEMIAQSESGSAAIEGTVTDANRAAVSGASVTVRNLETGLERVATTDEGGRYAIRVLPVGRYTIRVQAPGFAEGKQNEVICESARRRP